MATARGGAAGSTRTASDVFEVVADGNADMLEDMIEFSGAEHLRELRSKKQEDYGQNLLHCAVANGQLRTLQVLLKQKVFDPNQVRWKVSDGCGSSSRHESLRTALLSINDKLALIHVDLHVK